MADRERARLLMARLLDSATLAEVFVKEGRTRRVEYGPEGASSSVASELGWAVRAGGDSGTGFATGTGLPPPRLELSVATGERLTLPSPDRQPGRSEEDSEVPLIVEGEAVSLLEAVESELTGQLPGARLLKGVLEDGMSASVLVNSRGIDIGYRSRACWLMLEVAEASRGMARTVVEVGERDAGRLQPRALARRLVDSLTARAGAGGPDRDRGEVVLAPGVAARILAALEPLWDGAAGAKRALELNDRNDRLGSSLLTVVDDGDLAGGVMASPWDGEGAPTRRRVLVDRGRYVQPLVDWREAAPPRWRASGCVRRPGWRDWPVRGPSHLFIEPDRNVAAGELVAAVTRGYYLLEAVGAVRVEAGGERFRVPVCGFSLDRGRAVETVGSTWLCGTVGGFLRGVRGVARDLAFVPAGGMIGSPSLLVGGLELRSQER